MASAGINEWRNFRKPSSTRRWSRGVYLRICITFLRESGGCGYPDGFCNLRLHSSWKKTWIKSQYHHRLKVTWFDQKCFNVLENLIRNRTGSIEIEIWILWIAVNLCETTVLKDFPFGCRPPTNSFQGC